MQGKNHMTEKLSKKAKLEKKLGKSVIDIALKLPTLMDDIDKIEEAGIKIKFIDGPCKAYYDKRKRTIFIGKWCPRNYKLISIAHEFVHAILNPTQDPVPGKTGRKEFIERCLEEETMAIIHEINIVKELVKANVKIDNNELEWLKRYEEGGKKAIYKALKTTITSTTGEDYPEYYGGWYDESIPARKRLP